MSKVPPGLVIISIDSEIISVASLKLNWLISLIPKRCNIESLAAGFKSSNLNVPFAVLWAMSSKRFFSNCVAMSNKLINLEALFSSPTSCKAFDNASFIFLYWPLNKPPVAAVCLPIILTIGLSTIKFAGKGAICKVFPSLFLTSKSFKISFISFTANTASPDSSLFFKIPLPEKISPNFLITGSITIVPPVATKPLKAAESNISPKDCSLIPLNSCTPSCAISPAVEYKAVLVNKPHKSYPVKAAPTGPGNNFVNGFIKLAIFFDPAKISPVITPKSS